MNRNPVRATYSLTSACPMPTNTGSFGSALTQAAAAQFIGIDQPKVSAMHQLIVVILMSVQETSLSFFRCTPGIRAARARRSLRSWTWLKHWGSLPLNSSSTRKRYSPQRVMTKTEKHRRCELRTNTVDSPKEALALLTPQTAISMGRTCPI